MLRLRKLCPLLTLLLAACVGSVASDPTEAATARQTDRVILTSDGVRLHVIEAGPPSAHTIVFVPGWTMPAWIFQQQIAFFSQRYHVVALDPRGQGSSDVPAGGYEPGRRGQDIADLLAQLGPQPVVIAAWSLGVLDSLAYVHEHGDQKLAGLVLIDNSVGEDPPPTPRRPGPRRPPVPHDVAMRSFVHGMFHTQQSPEYLDALTAATLRTPEYAARALLSYPVPRSYWRDAVYSTRKPVFYIVRPAFAGQAGNLGLRRPGTETMIFETAGHALFVDEPLRFDAAMADFLTSRVWPR